MPGRYGYGRVPYVAPLQADASQGSKSPRPQRHRRSAAANPHHPTARGGGGHRTNNPNASNNLHLYSRPHTHARTQRPRNNQIWAPLYQPGSVNKAEVQQEHNTGGHVSNPEQHQVRPYNPLPPSSCTGEHARYRICSSNVCNPAFCSYSQYSLLVMGI